MDEIITFDKSYSKRYKEYCELLGNEGILPVSYIKKEWICYLQLTINICPWQAVWKIPRLTCESLGIHFPSVVLTLVLDVDFKEMRAAVKVLAVQDDISIPEIHSIPITQLWPTKVQNKNVARYIEEIADTLDIIRFFYLYLFMPWDYDDDENSDWKANHLESRLKLYYDLKHGKIPRATAEHIHSLLTEAKRLQNEKEYFELLLSENEEEAGPCEILEEKLLEIHVKLLEIRTEVHILENPMLREIKIKTTSDIVADSSNEKEKIWIIYNLGSADNYINFLQLVKMHYPTETLMFSTSLASILETSDSKDVFILNESQHNIQTTGALENGGILKGIGVKQNIIVTSKSEDTVLDIIAGTVLIENITISALSSQSALLIRSGKTVLKNCEIIGDTSSTHQGIVVLSNAELVLENCQMSGFSTAVVINSGTKVIMKNSSIHDVDIALNIFDKATVDLTNVSLRNCERHAMVLESNSRDKNNANVVGNFELLNTIPNITLESVTGDNNSNGDVAIVREKIDAC